MIVRSRDGAVEVVEVDDLGRLHVEIAGTDADLGELGPIDGEHAWLDVATLRRLAHADDLPAAWDADFDAMIEFAARHGWLSTDGASVRAHVVRVT